MGRRGPEGALREIFGDRPSSRSIWAVPSTGVKGRSRRTVGFRESTANKRSNLVRARVAALFTALLTAAGMLAVSASGPASAQSPFPGSAAFSGYATGATLHVDAVQGAAARPRVVDAELAFSGESANTAGLGSAISNEMSEVVQPAQASKNSYGRGSGVELGLGTTLPADPAANQLILAGLAQQAAAPTDS